MLLILPQEGTIQTIL